MTHLPLIGFCNFLNSKGLVGQSKFSKKYLRIFILILSPLIPLGFRNIWVSYILQVLVLYHFQVHRLKLKKLAIFMVTLIAILTAYGTARELLGNQDKDISNEDYFRTSLLRSPGTETIMASLKYFNEDGGQHFG